MGESARFVSASARLRQQGQRVWYADSVDADPGLVMQAPAITNQYK